MKELVKMVRRLLKAMKDSEEYGCTDHTSEFPEWDRSMKAADKLLEKYY